MIKIRAYQPQIDLEAVFSLWQTTLNTDWQLDYATFSQLIDEVPVYRTEDRLVAYTDNGEIVGFVATQAPEGSSEASLVLLMVNTEWQRQGIGKQLHAAALQHLTEFGPRRTQLGGGAPRIWPGVSTELNVGSFFQKQGWDYTLETTDLIQDLTNYSPPADALNPLTAHSTILQLATAADYNEICDFQKLEFPNWLDAYLEVMDLDDYNDILLVRSSKSNELMGMVIMYSAASNPKRTDVNWKIEFGANAGSIGCVGIAKAAHGQGLGSAMMTQANKILRECGVGICFIGWTTRVSFYQHLGYQIWKTYKMSWRNV